MQNASPSDISAFADINLSLRVRRRPNDSVYQRLGYSKGAGDSCRLHPSIERGANDIYFPFRNVLNDVGLFAKRCRLGHLGPSSLAGTGRGNALIAPIDLGGNSLTEPLKLRVVQIPQRGREVGRQRDAWRDRRIG